MKFIFGKKLDMSQVWRDDKVLAVTRVQAGPCPIVQIKSEDKDGYAAVQLGYGNKKEKNIKKPQKGHLSKLKISARGGSASGGKNENLKINLKYLREFRCATDEILKLNVGDVVDAATFAPGDKIEVEGISKGKGFQGVVKRHGFHGQDKTHGNKDQLRMPGSIGSQALQRVVKGKRMAGRMGGSKVTVKNLEIVGVDNENNILFVKGAVPGAKNSLVLIAGEGELKVKAAAIPEEIKEEVKTAEEIGREEARGKESEKKEVKQRESVKKEEIKSVMKETKGEIKKEEEKETKEDMGSASERTAVKEEKREKKKENFFNKLNKLPEEAKEKISSPEMMETINKTEEKYEIDLVPLVAKAAVGELKEGDLKNYLKDELKMEEAKAEQLSKELKDNIFSKLK